MKYFLLIIVASIALRMNLIHADGLELRLRTNKTHYLECEPVWLYITLVNTANVEMSTRCFCLFPQEGAKLKLALLNSELKIIPGYFEHVELDDPSKVKTFLPEEEMEYFFNMLDYYTEELTLLEYYLPADTYRLTARCAGLRADTIAFEVAPLDATEQSVRSLFKKASFDYITRRDINGAIAVFYRIIREHGDSPFAELAYDNLAACYSMWLEDKATALEIYREMLDKYPQTGFLDNVLNVIAYAYPEVAEQVLTELAAKHEAVNPRIRKVVNRQLENLRIRLKKN